MWKGARLLSLLGILPAAHGRPTVEERVSAEAESGSLIRVFIFLEVRHGCGEGWIVILFQVSQLCVKTLTDREKTTPSLRTKCRSYSWAKTVLLQRCKSRPVMSDNEVGEKDDTYHDESSKVPGDLWMNVCLFGGTRPSRV